MNLTQHDLINTNYANVKHLHQNHCVCVRGLGLAWLQGYRLVTALFHLYASGLRLYTIQTGHLVQMLLLLHLNLRTTPSEQYGPGRCGDESITTFVLSVQSRQYIVLHQAHRAIVRAYTRLVPKLFSIVTKSRFSV